MPWPKLSWFKQNQNWNKSAESGKAGGKVESRAASHPTPAPPADIQSNAIPNPSPALPQTLSGQTGRVRDKDKDKEKITVPATPGQKLTPALLPNTLSGVAPAHIQAALATPAALLPSVKMPMPIRVLLVDDDASLRAHIKQYLLAVANRTGKLLSGPGQLFEIVGEAANGRLGLDLIGELSPDIVLFDINMPFGGVELAKEIHQKYPAQRRIVLSSNLDITYAQMFFHLEVQGYLHKACSMQELRTALFSVMAGGVWLTWALDSDPQDEAGLKAAIAAFVKVLTSEERRYLQMFLLKGGSDSHLAQGLGIAAQKAAEYRSRFFTALGVSQRITLVLDGVYWMMALTGKHLEPVAPASDAHLAELGQLVRAASQRQREQLKRLKVKEQPGQTQSERPGGK